MSCSGCEHIDEYIELVKSGEVAACVEQHLLVAFIERIFKEEELTVNSEQLEQYLSYQKYFPFDLFPWEKFCFALHNCVYDSEGELRFPDLLIYVGRGAGKNGYLAFEDFCLITPANGIPKYHVDICANSEEQAKTTFQDIKDILESSRSKMKKHFRWTETYIRNLKTGSVIKFRTNNPKSKDGLRSGKVDFDEVHEFENWDNINVFTTGLGKKPHPRMTYITTDGNVREGVLDALKERSLRILNGEEEDNGLLPFICRLDSEQEVHDSNKWVKANPSLPYMPNLMREIKRKYATYKTDPIRNSGFMVKRMNRPQGNVDLEVTSWGNILKTNRELPDLEGKECVLGIDYTKTTDFMGAFLLFKDGGNYYGIHHSWFCAQSRDKSRIKIPLEEMEQRGLLTIVDDVEVHPYLIAEWIVAMRQKYSIRKVAMDSYRFALLKRELASIGFDNNYGDIKMVRPSDIMYAQNKISSAFASGSIIWGDDPLMRWYTNNAKLEPAPNNNFKYGKIEPKSRKTDGFMAFVHAMTVEDELPEETESVFFEPIIFN
jgi:phage terminase large subunit-like protein